MKNSQIDIEWKVCGILPFVENIFDGKYFSAYEDKNYIDRNLGKHGLSIKVYSLTPTNLFFQILNKELSLTYGIQVTRKRFPYILPLKVVGQQEVKFRAKLFEPDVIVMTVSVNAIERLCSVSELSNLQLLSSHDVISAVCRFLINVHSFPNASQVEVSCWKSIPLLKIRPLDDDYFVDNELVSIVTRHEQMNDRASSEFLGKNAELNFNEDIMLIDKQGILFRTITSDRIGQKNRLSRISSIVELALYIKALEEKLENDLIWKSKPETRNLLNRVDQVISSEVLNQSVSAKRGWKLLKNELDISAFSVDGKENTDKKSFICWLKRFIWNPLSAFLYIVAAIISILTYIKSQ